MLISTSSAKLEKNNHIVKGDNKKYRTVECYDVPWKGTEHSTALLSACNN